MRFPFLAYGLYHLRRDNFINAPVVLTKSKNSGRISLFIYGMNTNKGRCLFKQGIRIIVSPAPGTISRLA
jgi:hypothetical protein